MNPSLVSFPSLYMIVEPDHTPAGGADTGIACSRQIRRVSGLLSFSCINPQK